MKVNWMMLVLIGAPLQLYPKKAEYVEKFRKEFAKRNIFKKTM